MTTRTEELHRLICELVVRSNSRVGDGFPIAYVLQGVERAGYSDAEFIAATDSLRDKGLLTEDDCIGKRFF